VTGPGKLSADNIGSTRLVEPEDLYVRGTCSHRLNGLLKPESCASCRQLATAQDPEVHHRPGEHHMPVLDSNAGESGSWEPERPRERIEPDVVVSKIQAERCQGAA